MPKPLVSICMTTYNRAPLLKNTLDRIYTQDFKDFELIIVDDGDDSDTPVMVEGWLGAVDNMRYIRLGRQKHPGYNNPAFPNNVALRHAQGDLVVLQNAECQYASEQVLSDFVSMTGANDAVMGRVEVLDVAGKPLCWYVHPAINPRPFFFCGCLRREWFNKLRGFDEDYTNYGMEDVDFADRLTKAGVRFVYSEIPIQHQWHGPSLVQGDPNNNIPIQTYHRKSREMAEGLIGIERNPNGWGGQQ